jgi:hypothetical protein
MKDLAHQPPLIGEATAGRFAHLAVDPQELDRTGGGSLQIPGAVHRSHRTASQECIHAVTTTQLRTQQGIVFFRNQLKRIHH